MTVVPGPMEQLERLQIAAQERWDDEFTIEATLYNDGYYHLKAYHTESYGRERLDVSPDIGVNAARYRDHTAGTDSEDTDVVEPLPRL